MKKVKSIILDDILKVGPGFGKRAAGILLTEILTGFFLAFLINVSLGTDPFTFMNVNIEKRTGISFGTCELLLNLAMFAAVIAASRFHYIGLGTIANMVLIGYSSDLTRFLCAQILPEGFFAGYPQRIIFFLIGLSGFVICTSIYMNYDMGMSPYDSFPSILWGVFRKVPYAAVRICWDFSIIGIGCLLGGTPPIGTLILAVVLGPVITFVGKLMKR